MDRGNYDARFIHVAMFPFFAFGHISPFVQLSKKLAAHGAKISFLSAPANVARITTLLSPAAAAASIDIIPLEIPAVDGLPPGIQSTADTTPAAAELLKKAIDLMQPQIATLLSDLRPHVVVHDFAHQWLPSLASPLGVKTLFFSVFSAVSTAFLIVYDRRRGLSGDPPDVQHLKLPPPGFPSSSCIDSIPTYQARDFLYVFKCFEGGTCVYDRVDTCMRSSSAILIKSCMEMEGAYVRFVEAQYGKPVLLAGPVVPEPPSGKLEKKWAAWLDGFPEGSVVFCSFGSETFLTDEGVRELALGLELTGMPFFLVLNFPVGARVGGAGGDEEEAAATLRKKLPEGFEERVKGRAAVHSGWVQQQHILAHRSVGCFLCHAGLSSVMEGVANGCQLVMLPQRGDQFLNARLFAGDLEAGVEVSRRDEDGSFTKDDVNEAVKKVMVVGEEEDGRRRRVIMENHRRWREFLLDQGRQDAFMEDFVGKLKEMILA